MRKHVYKALRTEAVQAIVSVRQLAIGENAAFAIILVELLKTKSLYELLALNSVLIGLVFFASRLGRDWFIQAYRQFSYIFVAYELTERNRPEHDPVTDSFNFWVLANRSEAFLMGDLQQFGAVPLEPTPLKPFRAHTPGRELRTFLMHQFLLLMIAVIATMLAAIRVLVSLVPGLDALLDVKVTPEHIHNIHQLKLALLFNSPLIALNIVLSILLVIYIRKQISQADEAINRLTRNWLDYNKQRKKWDDQYIAARNFHMHHADNPPDTF